MKKLFVMNEYISSSRNGIGTYIKQLIACLSETDIMIGILLFNSNKLEFSIEDSDGIRYFHFPPFPDKSILEHSLVINKLLRLYISDSNENLFMINYSPCSLFMKEIKNSHPCSRLIYVIHDMAWTLHLFGNLKEYIKILRQQTKKVVALQYSSILKFFEEEVEICSYADKVICLSEDTYFLLEKYYSIDRRKLYLIPNCLFTQINLWTEEQKNKFKKEMLLQEEEKILLYVGRITEQKGFMVFIEAFKEIIRSYPSCRLVVVGSTVNWNNICKFCYPVLSKILFTGSLSSNELEKWYQIADIGIFPSYTEQCSYVGLEMMAHGLPVIASDGFGVRCMYKDGVNAKIAKIGNRNSLKMFKTELIKSTLTLLTSISYCKRLSNNSLKYYQANYSIKNIRIMFEDL